MPFTLIKGTFHVVGYSPDGDSIRFQAANNELWEELDGPPVTLNGRGHAQLRLEAIDTLETHFMNSHQPLEFALAALNALLVNLGIENVVWNPSRTMVISASDAVDGYILSREVEKNHRPVAFAFSGDTDQEDGSQIFLMPDLLRQSVNHQQVAAGMAYATYYKGLFPVLRNVFSASVQNARSTGLGLWPSDRTELATEIQNQQQLEEDFVIMPKLFRRLTEHLQGGGSIANFKEFLASKQEGIFIIHTAHPTHFDTVVEVEGETVRMTVPPEDIIFEG
jgi:endonuclease YncB( thermonuclease family)